MSGPTVGPKIISHVSDGSAAAGRVGGGREERENASSKGQPVGREGRGISIRQKCESFPMSLKDPADSG